MGFEGRERVASTVIICNQILEQVNCFNYLDKVRTLCKWRKRADRIGNQDIRGMLNIVNIIETTNDLERELKDDVDVISDVKLPKQALKCRATVRCRDRRLVA